MSPEEAQRLGPDVYNALYGPGWDKIQGSPEANAAQAYPDFSGLINAEAFDRAVAGFPRSIHIEDRRPKPPGPMSLEGFYDNPQTPKPLSSYVEAARPFIQRLMSLGGRLNGGY